MKLVGEVRDVQPDGVQYTVLYFLLDNYLCVLKVGLKDVGDLSVFVEYAYCPCRIRETFSSCELQ